MRLVAYFNVIPDDFFHIKEIIHEHKYHNKDLISGKLLFYLNRPADIYFTWFTVLAYYVANSLGMNLCIKKSL